MNTHDRVPRERRGADLPPTLGPRHELWTGEPHVLNAVWNRQAPATPGPVAEHAIRWMLVKAPSRASCYRRGLSVTDKR
jgi:hypothetical protein